MNCSTFSFWFVCKIIFFFLSFNIQISIANPQENFLKCFSEYIPNNQRNPKFIYTQHDQLYMSVLNSTIQNLRFTSDTTPKPLVIVTPSNFSHIQASILCSKKVGLQIRTRSGGHDAEGLSYISQVPFAIVDLRNMHTVKVDIHSQTAWVEAGATLGEVYYWINEMNENFSFPGGYCPTVGVGGHFSGGGYGALMRNYGLAADNIIDAHLVNVDGKVLDRKSMGEDLFWAIRGGGGENFGIIAAWKIKLVVVPSKATIFSVKKNMETHGLVKLFNKWQNIAYKYDKDLMLTTHFRTRNITDNHGKNKTTVHGYFSSIFLGGVDSLVDLMNKSFPELGIKKTDCKELSWIDTTIFYSGVVNYNTANFKKEIFLDRSAGKKTAFSIKLDYVKKLIPETAMVKILEKLYEEEVGVGMYVLYPYDGIMDEISESAIPFPHRAGIMYELWYTATWEKQEDNEKHINWVRSVYNFTTPCVSQNPRLAYLNYRDLDLGKSNPESPNNYTQARIWGEKYFGKNFNRLVKVKTKADPNNFFRNEQSIPPLPPRHH
ncbi:LOW QUALITY PROTEIN: cannabichromenic acid synthase [Cannabis sativa]|uniref:LOW QUALITY PROTEIN: cannabichromenic acid synthase n=1 Tax=Cannabis sativa TaxID=3483 RepID=UPI0029C9CC7F|nr:LOW QUALITY PROTEIN: cannabichromenic acid synthase [Cannabis sativa]